MSENKGYIEIHITGDSAFGALSPESYDIRELKDMLEAVEDMLFPIGSKGMVRPNISYEMLSGSVRHRFNTSMQIVAQFGALIALIHSNNSLDGLEWKSAQAFERIQKVAKTKNYSFGFLTSCNPGVEVLQITPTSNFVRGEDLWIDGEFYLYGNIVDAGGKNEANIHLDVKGHGVYTISAPKEYLKNQERNLLYHECGVRVKGKRNMNTYEIDGRSLELVSLIDYSPRFDEEYINGLINNASARMSGIDTDEWMDEVRGRK